MYIGIADSVDETLKKYVIDFILKASNNEKVAWPGYNCVIWKNGMPIRVLKDRCYSTYDSEMYIGHDPEILTPTWVPGALSAIAQFFGISTDPEVRSAIIKMAFDITVGIFSPLKQNLAETSNGLSLTHLAIHQEKHLLAGEYPPETLEGPPVWRLMSGEIIDIDNPGWTKFTI